LRLHERHFFLQGSANWITRGRQRSYISAKFANDIRKERKGCV
jgi:hypothetical protein